MRHLLRYALFESSGKYPKVFLDKPELDKLLYEKPTESNIKLVNSYMNKTNHRYDEDKIRLYHGTSANFKEDILSNGLKHTTKDRRNTYGSSSGYVYMSVFPGMARQFAELAFPRTDVVVFQVDIYVRDPKLVPDKDQLANLRRESSHGRHLKDSIGHSILYGRGLRYKGDIPPYMIDIYEE